MMYIRFVFYVVGCCFLLSCRGGSDSEKVVGTVAKEYYSYLLSGDFESYVDASYRAEVLRAADRRELIDNLRMFMSEQEHQKQGIKSVEVSSVDIDEEAGMADVLLVLSYGDGSQEVICEPLVKHEGLWYLR